MNKIDRVWPRDAAGKLPYWVYSDPEVYAAELGRIRYAPHWLSCGLKAESPRLATSKRPRRAARFPWRILHGAR
jgi:salicylate 5-hydroxylase large subunit